MCAAGSEGRCQTGSAAAGTVSATWTTTPYATPSTTAAAHLPPSASTAQSRRGGVDSDSRIVHAQAKDLQILPGTVDRYGFFGKAVQRNDPWDTGWWRYRVPGRGQIDWNAVVDALYENGFTGTLSVEHEDPVWSGTEEKVKTGLEIAHRTLRSLMA
ncbi:hypothetical protein [Streptomyces sp. NPDC047043]|uniref:sugar phosphate isomerase/epimerase family protein n=1 Tax=Streptomyces sp. NPDC047043 TaxID=3154497 RepID=UPI0033D521E8